MTEALSRLVQLDWINDYAVAVDAVGGDEWLSLLSIHFSRVLSFEIAGDSVGLGNVEIRHLDLAASPLDRFALAFCGLLRVGANGAAILRGAEKTIRRCWPVLVIAAGQPAAAGAARAMGYRELFRTGQDQVLVYD